MSIKFQLEMDKRINEAFQQRLSQHQSKAPEPVAEKASTTSNTTFFKPAGLQVANSTQDREPDVAQERLRAARKAFYAAHQRQVSASSQPSCDIQVARSP